MEQVNTRRKASQQLFVIPVDLVYSPEIVDKSIVGAERRVNPRSGTIDYVKDGKLIFRTHPIERPFLVFQLGSSDPQLAVKAALTVQQDVAAFDLNCGCPKRFSIQAGMGAALLKQPDLLCSILEALIRDTERPVSAKVRLFLDDLGQTGELLKRIIKTGVSALTVHSRDPVERSDKHPAHWNLFLKLAAVVKQANAEVYGSNNIDKYATLILNGDIGLRGNCSYVPELDLKSVLKAAGVSSIMSARAVQWNPLCLRDLKSFLMDESVRTFTSTPLNIDRLIEASKLYLCFAFQTANPFHNTKYILLQIWNQVASKDGQGRAMAVAVQQAKSNADYARLFGIELADSGTDVEDYLEEE